MKIVVPKMHWRDYLEIAGSLRKDPRFVLANQDLENGYVKFRSEKRLLLLRDLLEYHNTGRLPVSTIKLDAVSAAKRAKIGFDMEAWIASLGQVRGPDTNGFYTGQCPSCASKGGDTDRNHLAYTDDGAIHCFAGCNYYAIIDGFYQKPTLTVDGVSIEGTYVLHPAEEEGA
mgnify:CR=1 FL=1